MTDESHYPGDVELLAHFVEGAFESPFRQPSLTTTVASRGSAHGRCPILEGELCERDDHEPADCSEDIAGPGS